MTNEVKHIYFDTDLGVDDSLALAYLLASPAIDLLAVGTVCGNTGADQAARNTLDLLDLGGYANIPVAVGERDFRVNHFDDSVKHIHGDNGVGNIELPHTDRQPVKERACEMIIRLSHEYAGQLHLVAVGPLTNLAAALEQDSTLPSRIASVTIMGGAAMVPGNISPVTEANVGNDPESSRMVFDAPWQIIVAPLDLTMANTFEEEHRQALIAGSNSVGRAVGEILDFYFDFHVPEYGRRCSAVHDPIAAALCAGGVSADVAPCVPVTIDDTQGPGRGQMIVDLRGQRTGWHDVPGAHVRVVLETATNVAQHLVDVINAHA